MKKSRSKSSRHPNRPPKRSATLVWFRSDLRLSDNHALATAAQLGGPVIPVFLWAPGEEGDWAPAGASRWWLHQSLKSLAAGLRRLGSPLIIRRESALPGLKRLIRETGAGGVFWNRRYEPEVLQRDRNVEQALLALGIDARTFNGALLFEPSEIRNRSGKPYRVFTPFWRACLSGPSPPFPVGSPSSLPAHHRRLRSLAIEDLQLEPRPDWASGIRARWCPGEHEAERSLKEFVAGRLKRYPADRERPDLPGSSRMSPHLHFGEISPRQIWHEVTGRLRQGSGTARKAAGAYLRELGWREFAHHLLFHFPRTPAEPLRPEFADFPWQGDSRALEAWQRGRTGYPLVDAGMRELWETGWMHNRVRMVVASFLVKHLLLPWQEGARWFWDTLVDADLANNTLGWQWAAGCGADAAPFFRIFNPVTQGRKFDTEGTYVRRWVPELALLPERWIHSPWQAPASILARAGVVLGRSYPEPIVAHSRARERALAALAEFRSRTR